MVNVIGGQAGVRTGMHCGWKMVTGGWPQAKICALMGIRQSRMTRVRGGQATSGVCSRGVKRGVRISGPEARSTAALASTQPWPYCSLGTGSPGLSRSGRAVARRMSAISVPLAAGLTALINAATPATWGVAIEVPLIVVVPPAR